MSGTGKEISVLLVGIGGYGKTYLDALCKAAGSMPGGALNPELRNALNPEPGGAANRTAAERIERCKPFRIAGAVDVAPAARAVAAERGIPLYGSVGAFYASDRADLAVLSTPIHFHCEQIKQCLSHGSNVLCEKPLCATAEEAEEILLAEKASGRFVRVGYQLSFSDSVLALKADILSGVFGKPLVFKAIVHYPRNEAYYARNGWAGKKRSADGRMILDSPVHNAVAHHLNNMLFLLGGALDAAARLKTVQAELYRGNPSVENFDTTAIKCTTESGAQIFFYTSHCVAREKNLGPVCQYRFEKAAAVHTDDAEHETFHALFDDGSSRLYAPVCPDQTKKLWDCIAAVRGGPIPPSGAEAAAAEVICVNGAQLSHPIATIPGEYVTRTGAPGERVTAVRGLEDMLYGCFDRMLLPSEAGAGRPPWLKPGKIINACDICRVADFI